MTVSFGHLAQVATVWIPELSPTRATSISTLLAILFCAALMGGIGAMYAGMCMENGRPVRVGVISALAVLAIVAAFPSMRNRVFHTAPIASAGWYPERADAEAAARAAAAPAHAWHPVAKARKAPSSVSKVAWSSDDLQRLSAAAQKQAHLTESFPDSEIVIDTTSMDDSQVAAHGTSYLKGSQRVRCVAELQDVKQNNVGQPISATLQQVRCETAASPTATS